MKKTLINIACLIGGTVAFFIGILLLYKYSKVADGWVWLPTLVLIFGGLAVFGWALIKRSDYGPQSSESVKRLPEP